MTKAELIEKLHGDLEMDLSKKALGEIVDGLFEAMRHAIKDDERFSYPGFGTFVVRTRKARKGRNPKTGAEITIAESSTVGFKPAKNFKDLIS